MADNDRVPKGPDGKPRRRTNAEVIVRVIKDRIAESSGMAARAGRAVSGRRAQIDSAVDRATRGEDNELHRKIRDIDRETTR